MATLAFNAVGSALGGPIGGAIGSMVGSQIDAAVFGTSRQGRRLSDLAVTTSTYGDPLKRHFGRMRIAGSMIWATDLVEHSEVEGAKGSASTTTYSYTANFAVALASRPILSLGRIWADGKLLRGADGDLKVSGKLRIYLGHGDQAADPLIEANEGAARAPAHRGLAYVVFEDLDLSDYYSRIPSLTFEVIADDSFDLQSLVGDVLNDIDAAVDLQGMSGFSCESALADDLQAIDAVVPLSIDVAGEAIVIGRERLQSGAIALSEAAVSVADDAFGGASGYTRTRSPQAEQPARALRYFDTDRDYQVSLQFASGQFGSGQFGSGQPETLELPAALDADHARALIETCSRRIDWSRDRISWRTAELNTAVAPGALVTLPGIAGQWLVHDWEWRAAGIELSLERVLPTGADTTPQLAADGGRNNPAPDLAIGTTDLVTFELPLDGTTGDTETARPTAAVSSASTGWSGAALYADRGDGALHALGPSSRTRAVLGSATSILPSASPLLFDRGSQLTVTLIDAAMQLPSASAEQLAEGANLALVGSEIIQFTTATSLGSGAWQLQGLLRGRAGTESGIAAHAAGERFVLLGANLVTLDPATLGSASARQVIAVGRGDDTPVSASLMLDGITLRPLAPVHPRFAIAADGARALTWTRRARGGWSWQDGVDVPLVEQAESYLVTLGPIETPYAIWTVSEPRLDIAATQWTTLAASYPNAALQVRQQGTHALSEPLLLPMLA